MRVGFIGCVESSKSALETLHSIEGVGVVAVVTKRLSSVNSDFVDLSVVCDPAGIPVFFEGTNDKQASKTLMREHSPDVIYCIGWSYLLDGEMLGIPPKGAIGFLSALLPQNWGRYPLIWALALGLSETASTFFFMDEGADSGPIISQVRVPISLSDNARDLYSKVMEVGRNQIIEFTPLIKNDAHSDHEAVYDAVTSSCKMFRNPGVKKLVAYETLSETGFCMKPEGCGFRPNLYIDMTGYLDKKVEAFHVYESEVGVFPFPESEKAIRALAAIKGVQAGNEAAESSMRLRS